MNSVAKISQFNVSRETCVLFLFSKLARANSTIGCIFILIILVKLIDIIIKKMLLIDMIYLKIFIKNIGKS